MTKFDAEYVKAVTFDICRTIIDPEKPLTLEDLEVI